MISADVLRKQLKQYRDLALDIYDKMATNPDQVRNLLAHTVDNRTDRENPVNLDQDFFFTEAYAWDDDQVVHQVLDRVEFVVPMKGYSAVLPYNRVNVGRPDRVAKLERLVRRLPDALFRKQTAAIMDVFRKNPLAYDGQNFFDASHQHPGSKGTYDNTLAPNWADPAAPTFDEAQALVRSFRERFVTNHAIQAEVLDAGQIDKQMILIVHNAAHWTMFEQVRKQTTRSNIDNDVQGTFELKVDQKPTSGQENRIEAVLATPDGPRPAFFVPDMDPYLDVDEANRTRQEYYYVAQSMIFGVKPGFPQAAIQARPT